MAYLQKCEHCRGRGKFVQVLFNDLDAERPCGWCKGSGLSDTGLARVILTVIVVTILAAFAGTYWRY